MLYVLTGSDTMKAKARAQALAKGHELLRFGEGGEAFGSVLERIGAQGLFAAKLALLLDRPSEDSEGKTLLAEHAKDFAEADMPVIVIEPDLDAATKKAIAKHAEVEEFELKKKKEVPINPFALSDAFASGNRKDAWILYRRLIGDGVAAEQIHGMLAYRVRKMAIADKTRRASPTVQEKSEELSRELVRLLHTSRMGGGDLEDLLEVFLLKKA